VAGIRDRLAVGRRRDTAGEDVVKRLSAWHAMTIIGPAIKEGRS
jgi:hypothetical protein